MKSAKAAVSSIDSANLSVPAAEEIIEEALNELAYSQDPGLARALRFLAPVGYQAIVELCSENGRSKRRNASADSWSPEDDEVRIYFERIDDGEPSGRSTRSLRSRCRPRPPAFRLRRSPCRSRCPHRGSERLRSRPACRSRSRNRGTGSRRSASFRSSYRRTDIGCPHSARRSKSSSRPTARSAYSRTGRSDRSPISRKRRRPR